MKKALTLLLTVCLLTGVAALADQTFVGPADNIDVYVHSYVPGNINFNERFTVTIPDGFIADYPIATARGHVQIWLDDFDSFPMNRTLAVEVMGADHGFRCNEEEDNPDNHWNFTLEHDDRDSWIAYSMKAERDDGCGYFSGWEEYISSRNTVVTKLRKAVPYQGEDANVWSDQQDNWARSDADLLVEYDYLGADNLHEGNYNDWVHFNISSQWTYDRDEIASVGWEYVSREKYVDGEMSGIEGWQQVDGWQIMRGNDGNDYYVTDGGNWVKDEAFNDVDSDDVPDLNLQTLFWDYDDLFYEDLRPIEHRVAGCRPIENHD